MKELIEELKKENEDILLKNPKLAMVFDWTPDSYRLEYNKEMIKKLFSLQGVGSSEITTNDLGTEFIIIRDDLVEIEKGSVVVLLEINSSGRHEFMDKSNDVYWFEADCVERKK